MEKTGEKTEEAGHSGGGHQEANQATKKERKLRAKKRYNLKMKRDEFKAKRDVDCIRGHWSKFMLLFH